MERLVNNTILNCEYKEDALNNKLTSANLYDHVNLLPKFYDGISEKKIIELQRKFKELSNTYEKTYLTLANKKKSREQPQCSSCSACLKFMLTRTTQPQPKPINEITVGSRWLFTGHPQVNSYGNGGHGRYFYNHNVYIVDIRDGRAFPYRLGDNYTNQFGWANADMLHY